MLSNKHTELDYSKYCDSFVHKKYLFYFTWHLKPSKRGQKSQTILDIRKR